MVENFRMVVFASTENVPEINVSPITEITSMKI